MYGALPQMYGAVSCLFSKPFAPATDPPPFPRPTRPKSGETPPVAPVRYRSVLRKNFAPAKSWSRGIANLAGNGSWENLSGIQKDTMLVVGTSDVMTPQAVAVQMAGQINGSWLIRFKDLPHIGSRSAPVEYGENALNFFGTNELPPYTTP